MPKQAALPARERDLSLAERELVRLLQDVGFGRLECIRIRGGAVVFDPSPTVVRVMKFGTGETPLSIRSASFELKKSVAELVGYIRGVEEGEIQSLEVRHGLPFSMELQYRIPRGMPDVKGAHVDAV